MNQPTKKSGAFLELVGHTRMVFELLKHPRVPFLTKLIPLAAIVYVIVPVDLIPFIPVLDAVDDIAILGAALSIFYMLVPRDVVEEIEQRLNGTSTGQTAKPKIDDQIIDGEFVEVEDDPRTNS